MAKTRHLNFQKTSNCQRSYL